MKVLVLGATGYIGGAVVERLVERGHEVAALVRQQREIEGVKDVRTGDLADLGSLKAAVTDDIDAIVHAAVLTGDKAHDLASVEALGKPIVYVSGVWVLGPTRDGQEDSPVNPVAIVGDRPEVEQAVLGRGGIVVRPGVVHGRGAGIVSLLVGQAAERGVGAYVVGEDKTPTWTFVHVDDLADLIVTAVEKGRPGAVYHGVAEEAVSVAEIARAASKVAGVREGAEPWPVEEAAQVFGGPFAEALALSQRAGARRTKEELGWEPGRPGALADLAEGSYVSALS
ncbi:NAD-dependent epimerase/dehydratase family protein [Nonomuraea sp. NPDC059194]|uniref:NAD-dependent epimerase/dehydratase family protein n=1 Tax=Nonomuraea sp. NPDC059194 TaxID=3346764 RepID=UPI0036C80267